MDIKESALVEVAGRLNNKLAKSVKKNSFNKDAPLIFADFFSLQPEDMREYPNRIREDEAEPEITYEADELGYTLVPHSGGSHGSPLYNTDSWYGWYIIKLTEMRAARGEPIALMIRPYNCPIPFGEDADSRGAPDAFAMALDNLPKLDYVLMDLEGDGEMIEANIRLIHKMVRSHKNPKIRQARLGNYSYSAVEVDEGMIWPSRRDLKNRDENHDITQTYLDCLDVSMPVAYPYQTASQHLSEYTQGENVAPNGRAAIFWQALERISAAARALPKDHLLMPWVGKYISYPNPNYNAPSPSEIDNKALIIHARMRKTDCFYTFVREWQLDYKETAMEAWHLLDGIFSFPVEKEFMNLETDKRSGFNWSGLKIGPHEIVLASNLSEEAVEKDGYRIEPGDHKFLVNGKVIDIPE